MNPRSLKFWHYAAAAFYGVCVDIVVIGGGLYWGGFFLLAIAQCLSVENLVSQGDVFAWVLSLGLTATTAAVTTLVSSSRKSRRITAIAAMTFVLLLLLPWCVPAFEPLRGLVNYASNPELGTVPVLIVMINFFGWPCLSLIFLLVDRLATVERCRNSEACSIKEIVGRTAIIPMTMALLVCSIVTPSVVAPLLSEQLSSTSWPVVDGIVLSCAPMVPPDRNRMQLSYQYEVNNQSLTGYRDSIFGKPGAAFHSHAEARMAVLQPGEMVAVSYDPVDPEKSLLTTGWTTDLVMWLLSHGVWIGLFFINIAILWETRLLKLYSRRRKTFQFPQLVVVPNFLVFAGGAGIAFFSSPLKVDALWALALVLAIAATYALSLRTIRASLKETRSPETCRLKPASYFQTSRSSIR